MPRRPLTHMPTSRRAKQFMPFRAMTGLEEALTAMESTPIPRPVLSEEAVEDLNRILQELDRRLHFSDPDHGHDSDYIPDADSSPDADLIFTPAPDSKTVTGCEPDSDSTSSTDCLPMVQITWYHAGQIHTKTGRLSRIDCTRRCLCWDQTDPIFMEDLLQISSVAESFSDSLDSESVSGFSGFQS